MKSTLSARATAALDRYVTAKREQETAQTARKRAIAEADRKEAALELAIVLTTETT